MNGFAEVFEQLRLLRVVLDIALPFVLMLTGVVGAAFVVYVLGVWRLCRAERQPAKQVRQPIKDEPAQRPVLPAPHHTRPQHARPVHAAADRNW